jgi:hypothetical protein
MMNENYFVSNLSKTLLTAELRDAWNPLFFAK